MYAGLAVLGLPAGLGAITDARAGRAALVRADRSIREQDAAGARAALPQARTAFTRAGDKLGSPLLFPARTLPVLGRNVRAARALARAGALAAEAGPAAVAAVEARPAGGWKLIDGALDLSVLPGFSRALDRAAVPLARARREIASAPGSLLFGPLAEARRTALEQISSLDRAVRNGRSAAVLLPPMLGSSEPRRYFLVMTNLAENRGSGGFPGYFGVVEARAGRLSFGASGRPTEELPPPGRTELLLPEWYEAAYDRRGGVSIWQSVNVSADFPTAGDLITQALRQPGSVGAVDGVIQIDPVALSALLQLTGPITVPPWPEPITTANVAAVTQHEAYVRLGEESDRRHAFLGNVTTAVVQKAFGGTLALQESALRALGVAVQEGHVRIYSTRPGEQLLLTRAGLAGGVDRAAGTGDVLGLATENWTPSKGDWFLRRSITYTVRPDPRTDDAETTLTVGLRNEGPSEGLPDVIIGGLTPEVPRGSNRQLVMLLRPASDEIGSFEIDGTTAAYSSEHERDLRNYSQFVTVPAGTTSAVSVSSRLESVLDGGGRTRTYSLYVLHQATVNADTYTIDVRVPRGWKADGPARVTGTLEGDLVYEVSMHQSARAWLLDTFLLRPVRTGVALVRSII